MTQVGESVWFSVALKDDYISIQCSVTVFGISSLVREQFLLVVFRLDNLYETIVLETQGDRITPLVTNPGRIMLTSSRLYFQPFNNVDPVRTCTCNSSRFLVHFMTISESRTIGLTFFQLPVLKIKITDIKRLIKRRFLLRHVVRVHAKNLFDEVDKSTSYPCVLFDQQR